MFLGLIVPVFFVYPLKNIKNKYMIRGTPIRGHQDILNRENFPEDRFINARMSPVKSLLVEGVTLHSQLHDFDISLLPGYNCMNNNTYPMIIKLIEGSLDGMDHWQSLFDKNITSSEDSPSTIPTMAFISLKVAQEYGTQLDKKNWNIYVNMLHIPTPDSQ